MPCDKIFVQCCQCATRRRESAIVACQKLLSSQKKILHTICFLWGETILWVKWLEGGSRFVHLQVGDNFDFVFAFVCWGLSLPPLIEGLRWRVCKKTFNFSEKSNGTLFCPFSSWLGESLDMFARRNCSITLFSLICKFFFTNANLIVAFFSFEMMKNTFPPPLPSTTASNCVWNTGLTAPGGKVVRNTLHVGSALKVYADCFAAACYVTLRVMTARHFILLEGHSKTWVRCLKSKL